MSAPAATAGRARALLAGRLAPVGVCAAAAGGGATAAFSVALALGATLALGVVLVIARDFRAVLYILVVSLFAEIISLNGIPISRVVAPVTLVLLLVLAFRGRLLLAWSAPTAWIAGYTIWAIASGLWSVDLDGTRFLLGSLGIALIYLAAFAGIVDSQAHLRKVLQSVAIAAFATGVFALIAFVLGTPGELQLGRTEGGAGDPNFFALYEIMALPLVLVLASTTTKPPQRLFLYLTAVVIVGAVVTTVSRGGLLTLAVLLLFLLILPARATVFSSGGQKAALATLLAVGLLATFELGSQSILPRLESVFSSGATGGLGSEARGNGRLNIWLGAATAIKERPLYGLGYGAFQPSLNDLLLRTPRVDLTTYELRPAGQPAHNAYLGTAAELGLPGLTLLLGVIVTTLLSVRRSARRARELGDEFLSRVAAALALSLGGWAVASLFLSSETSRVLWIVLGLALALPRLLERAAEERAASPVEESSLGSG
jgi:O-antigen ligase